MKIKIICIMVSTLFLFCIIPVSCASDSIIINERDTPIQFGGYFIFGFMKLIDPEESISEFEVVSFIFLIGNGETIRLNEGEMIKIYEPIFGLIFNNLFIGFIGDYSIIG